MDWQSQGTGKRVSESSVMSGRGRETRPSTASSAFSMMLGDDDRPGYDPSHLHCEIIAVLLKVGGANGAVPFADAACRMNCQFLFLAF